MDTVPRGPAKDGAKPEEKRSLSHKISDFLRRQRGLLLGLVGLVLAAVLALAVVTTIRSSRDKAAAIALDRLSTEATAWGNEADEAKKAELERKLLGGIEDLVARWPRSVHAQQAWGMKAKVAESHDDWAGAEKSWLAAVEALPSSFIAAVSLQNAAIDAEDQDANDRAKEHYKALIDRYPAGPASIPHAWFALGRIAEEEKDYAVAVSSYEKVLASWPGSDWTKLSKDRILSIKSRGLVK